MQDYEHLKQREIQEERQHILGDIEKLLEVPLEKRDMRWISNMHHDSKEANFRAGYSRYFQLSSDAYHDEVLFLFIRAFEEMDKFDTYVRDNKPKQYKKQKKEIQDYLDMIEQRITICSALNPRFREKVA
jgi:hypothetical protein